MSAGYHVRGCWLTAMTVLGLATSMVCAQETSGRPTCRETSDDAVSQLASADPTSAGRSFSLSTFGQESQTTQETTAKTTENQTIEESPASPFSFDITYYLYSDYIFRGVNFSEYGTEGREKLNHQMATNLGVDIAALLGQKAGTYGTFTFGTWFEWYAAQIRLDPEHGGQNLQEVDYYLSWAYDVEPIATTMTIGYNFYTIANNKAANSSEWFLKFEHNDAWMWKWLFPENEEGVLNPSFMMVQDVDLADGGMWFEFGLSHGFEVFKNFTLTPSWLLAVDHRYLDPVMGTGDGTTRIAYQQFGLDATYDITELLKLPDWAGSVSVSGFLYFNDALGNAEDSNQIQDEFFGGMSVGWSLGG
jgi:hypothetical protein